MIEAVETTHKPTTIRAHTREQDYGLEHKTHESRMNDGTTRKSNKQKRHTHTHAHTHNNYEHTKWENIIQLHKEWQWRTRPKEEEITANNLLEARWAKCEQI